MSRHPSVKWAQRSDVLFITIELPDAKDVKLNLEPDGKFQFSAIAGPDKSLYEVNFDLFDKVDVNESKTSSTSRSICYLVQKAESKWWNRLVKQEGKPPVFLKVDWDKWVDEDEQDETAGNDFGDIDFSKLDMGGDEDLGGDDFGDDDGADDDDLEDESDSEEEKTKEASAVETSESPHPAPAGVVEATDAKA